MLKLVGPKFKFLGERFWPRLRPAKILSPVSQSQGHKYECQCCTTITFRSELGIFREGEFLLAEQML